MDIAAAFASIAQSVSASFGGPFHAALLHRPAPVVYNDGGSIVPGVTPAPVSCTAQVDAVTEAMRQADGFTERDHRILVLAATLAGEVTTADEIEVLTGPHAGRWMIAGVGRDPVGVYHELRGRRA